MAKNINDGGPAFPTNDSNLYPYGATGISKRDWFAGQALIGAMTGATIPEDVNDAEIRRVADEVAKRLYIFADAMIAERDKK